MAISGTNRARSLLDGICSKYSSLTDAILVGEQHFSVPKTDCVVTVGFEVASPEDARDHIVSSHSVRFLRPHVSDACANALSRLQGFDVPGTWADLDIANVGVDTVRVLPARTLTTADGHQLRCTLLEVRYGNYYEKVRHTKNPQIFWIDSEKTVRRIEINEVTKQGERHWIVNIFNILSHAPPNTMTSQLRSPLLGMGAPDFDKPTTNTSRVQLNTLRGKIVVLNFWATWCLACAEELPELEKLQASSTANRAVVLGVSDESETVVVNWLNANKRSFLSLTDSQSVFDSYGVTSIPTLVVIDPSGLVVQYRAGFQNGQRLREIFSKYAGK